MDCRRGVAHSTQNAKCNTQNAQLALPAGLVQDLLRLYEPLLQQLPQHAAHLFVVDR